MTSYTEPVLTSVTLNPPFFILSGAGSDKTLAPCGLILDTSTGNQYVPLFTSEANARHYLFRTGAKDEPRSLGTMNNLVDLAKILRLRHPNVVGFLLDPRGGQGPTTFLSLTDAMNLS